MKDLIVDKVKELFLTFGFKSVTMDHIANEMGISKKTIYNFFHLSNSTEYSIKALQVLHHIGVIDLVLL